jgi:hypothetical protein
MKLRSNASDNHAVISEAYGGEAVKKSKVFKWRKLFKKGRENVDDDERRGCARRHRTNENVGKSTKCIQINV